MLLLFFGAVLFLALLATLVSNKYGIPALLLFLALGMAFSMAGFGFDNFLLADNFASAALMVIMFYGGYGTKWKMAKPVYKEAVVLASLGVAATAILTGLFCHYILNFDFPEAMLIGSIVGSTDYASVSSILKSKNLNLRYSTAPLLEMESGSNDPMAYTMTFIFLSLIAKSSASPALLIVKQIAVGLGAGFILSYIFAKIIVVTRFYEEEGIFSIFMLAVMMISYQGTDFIGGNGFLTVYIIGMQLGNMQYKGKREIVFFFDGLSSLMQIGLFFLLGLLSDVSRFAAALPISAAIMMFMFIIARPLSVAVLMKPFKIKKNQLAFISLAGLRGAAAIAFAIMAVNTGLDFRWDIYHIVLGICFLSTLVQGFLMPIFAKKWDMLDPGDSVLKTFNFYQDKSPLSFIELTLKAGDRSVGKRISELNFAFNIIIAKIERNGKTIVPKGDTVLEAGDMLVFGGKEYFDYSGRDLTEVTIAEHDSRCGKMIKDMAIPAENLVVMMQTADGDIIIPGGNTVANSGDKLVILEGDK